MFDIKFHRLVGPTVTKEDTNNGGGPITPRFIVMHYTAGADAKSAVQTFKTPASKSSAHLVIDRDGSVTNMKAFNIKTWHAGPSRYSGFSGLNSCSIGIEIVNLGFLRKAGRVNGRDIYTTWNGESISLEPDEVVMCRYPKAGSGDLYWQKYTDDQLKALDEIVPLLLSKYPTILDIVGHEDIDTRGWKVDPGPAFPMRRYKALLDNRSDESTGDLLTGEDRGVVTASSLNVRSGPSMMSRITQGLRKDDKVIITRQNREWYHVMGMTSPKSEGWVHSDFIRRL